MHAYVTTQRKNANKCSDSGASLIGTPLGQKSGSGVIMYTNRPRVFGTATCVPFIEVSSLYSVLNGRFHCGSAVS